MDDRNSEQAKKVTNSESHQLSESEKQQRRKTALFALLTFKKESPNVPEYKDLWEGELLELRLGLTFEQVEAAKSIRDNDRPDAKSVLPESEFHSAHTKGYWEMWSKMFSNLEAYLLDEKADLRDKSARASFEQDPSGISYFRHYLEQIEAKAQESEHKFNGREEEFRERMSKINATAEKLRDYHPRPADLSYDEALAHAYGEAISPTKRTAFYNVNRGNLHRELPFEFTGDNSVKTTDSLIATGARLFFEKYQEAVNIYLSRWGEPIKPSAI